MVVDEEGEGEGVSHRRHLEGTGTMGHMLNPRQPAICRLCECGQVVEPSG
jgi:hypothetical protein